MQTDEFTLRYGGGLLNFRAAAGVFEMLNAESSRPKLSDAEIGERLDVPISSPSLEELAAAAETVLIVVPDATRLSGAGQLGNLVVRRLIAAGIQPYDIRIIFATGIHRKVLPEERSAILTPFIAQRLKTLDHEPRDLMQIVEAGTVAGIAVGLNRALFEHDLVITISGTNFHYFAGFSGGRKMICPGLASTRTIRSTHKLAFDCERSDRRDGVGPGILAGNPVNEAFEQAAALVKNVFNISTLVDRDGDVTAVYAGELTASHRMACGEYERTNTLGIGEKRAVVVAGCGGRPFDRDLIQAHKALDAAASACIDGGRIIFIAECGDGLGRSDLLRWFAAGDSRAMARELCERYQVNGQTAWTLRKKAERFDVRMITDLDAETVELMGMKKAASVDEALADINVTAGFVIEAAAAFKISSS